MTNRADLLLSIQANTEALTDVSTKLDRIGAASQRAAQQTTSAFDAIKTTAAGVFTGTALAGMLEAAGGAALALAGDAFKAGEGLEQLRVRYTTLLGSSAAANAEIAKLQQIANNSSFSLPTLAEGEARLISTGKSAEEARQIMIAVGNTAAGIGQNNEGIDGITTALTQIANKGKLSSEELGQLSERGVNGLQLLARALNLTTGETQKLVEQGRISSDTFLQAFQADSATRFGSAMQSNAQTMQGLMSTASDLKDTLLATFATEAFTAVEPVLGRILTELQDPRTVENIKEMGREFGKVVAVIGAGAEELGKLLGLIDKNSTSATVAATGQVAAAQSALQAAQQALQQKPIQYTTADDKERIKDINRQIDSTRTSYDKLIDAAREKLRVENESYQTAVRERDLARAREKLGDDRGLAGDIFSAAGAAARDRIKGDEQRVGDLEFQQAHERRVQGLQADVRAQEQARDAALDSLRKQKAAAEEGTKATKTQAQAVYDLTAAISDQVRKVAALALAYGALADAQEGERESGRTAVMNAAINQRAANDATHATASWLGALVSGNPEQEKAAYAEMRNAIGSTAAGAVEPFTPGGSASNNPAAIPAYQDYMSRPPVMGYQRPTPVPGGGSIGGVTVNITTGPASQTDWDQVADKIDKSLARHWGSP